MVYDFTPHLVQAGVGVIGLCRPEGVLVGLTYASFVCVPRALLQLERAFSAPLGNGLPQSGHTAGGSVPLLEH